MKKAMIILLAMLVIAISGCSLTGKSVAEEEQTQCKETQITYEIPQCHTEKQAYTEATPYVTEQLALKETPIKKDYHYLVYDDYYHYWSEQDSTIWRSIRIESHEDEAGTFRFTTKLVKSGQTIKEIEKIVNLKPREKKEVKVELECASAGTYYYTDEQGKELNLETPCTQEGSQSLAITPLELDIHAIPTIVTDYRRDMVYENVTKYQEETKYKDVIVCQNVTETKTVQVC